MRKILILISLAFGIIILAGCGQQQADQIQGTPIDKAKLNNTFKDEFIGYEIKYPENWTVSKNKTIEPSDSPGGKFSDVSIVLKNNSLPEINIRSIQIGDPANATIDGTKSVDDMTALDAINERKKTYIENGYKIYEESDFTYKFKNGKTITGKQLTAENNNDNDKMKERLIFIVNGKKVFRFTFRDSLNKYDSDVEIAKNMLDSWTIYP